jgi:hypothetical protein
MRHEKLYKCCIIEFLLPVLMVSLILKMNNLHGSVTSHHIKTISRTFLICFRIGLYKFCRTFDGTSFTKKIQYSTIFSSRDIYRTKGLPTFSVSWEMALPCKLFILSIRKTIRIDKKKFDHTAIVDLFTPHLLEKNSRFYHLPRPRYIQNKIMDTV